MKNFKLIKSSPQTLRKTVLPGLVFLLLIVGASCGKSSLDTSTTEPDENTAPKMTAFERDVKSMKTANFKYIYVFRRKDSGVLDAEDKDYLRKNIPSESNRGYLTDEEKAYIAGSNFTFPEDALKVLAERFKIEDLSPPAAEIEDEKKQVSNSNETENVNARQGNEQEGK